MLRLSTRVLRAIRQALYHHFTRRPTRGAQPAAISTYGSQWPNQDQSPCHDEKTHHRQGDKAAHGQVPLRSPGGEPHLLPQAAPALEQVFRRRLVVAGGQQHHVADLRGVEQVDRRGLVAGRRVPGLLVLAESGRPTG